MNPTLPVNLMYCKVFWVFIRIRCTKLWTLVSYSKVLFNRKSSVMSWLHMHIRIKLYSCFPFSSIIASTRISSLIGFRGCPTNVETGKDVISKNTTSYIFLFSIPTMKNTYALILYKKTYSLNSQHNSFCLLVVELSKVEKRWMNA